MLNALIGFRMDARILKLSGKKEFAQKSRLHESAEKYNKEGVNLKYCLEYRVLFPEVNRRNADVGFKNMLLYFINFGFYKFGLELVVMYVVILVGNTGDIFSVFYVVFLIPMLLCRRKHLKLFAKVFAVYVAFVCVVKYLLLIWLPPFETFCSSSFLNWLAGTSHDSESSQALKLFFFVYDFDMDQVYAVGTPMLFADMMLLIILRSFLKNLKAEVFDDRLREAAGNNEDCLDEPDMARRQYGQEVKYRIVYSKKNFLTEQKHPMNVLKKILFMHGIWLTYFFVCFCGLQTYDILGAPFIGFSVYLLWLGQDVALKTRPEMFKFLNRVLLYSVLIAGFRVCAQVAGFYCTEIDSDSFLANFVEIIDMRILAKYDLAVSAEDLNCLNLFQSNSIISWESTCIMILLVQRRIFLSHYYDFVIEESIVFRDLSEAGGKLIEKFNREDIAAAIAYRTQITKDLEEQIAAIRDRSKSLGSWYEPKDHLDAIFNGSRFFGTVKDNVPLSSPKGKMSGGLSKEKEKQKRQFTDGDVGSQWLLYIEKIKERTLRRCFPKTEETVTDEEQNRFHEESAETSVHNDSPVLVPPREMESLSSTNIQGNSVTAPLILNSESDQNDQSPSGIDAEIDDNDSQNLQNSRTWLLDDSIENPEDQKPVGGFKKLILLVTYVVFRLLAEIAYVFDHGSIGFHRILLSLEQIRAKRVGFLEAESADIMETRVRDRVTVNNYVCVDISNEVSESSDVRKPSRFQQHLDSQQDFNIYVLFIRDFWLSFYQFLISQTDHFCYFLIGIVVVLNGSIMDMTLSIITITWGLLSKPRPSKRFWKLIIFYTTVVIFVQWFFQTDVFEYNRNKEVSAPDWLETLIGNLDTKDSYVYVLLLLVALCFHRNILISYGLWSSYSSNRTEQELYNKEARKNGTALIGENSEDVRDRNSISESSVNNFAKQRKFSVAATSIVSEDLPTKPRGPSSNIIKRFTNCSELRYWASDVKNEAKYFAEQILDSNKTAIRDVYVPMFIFDILGYIIVTVGYSGFSESGESSSIVDSLLNNKVPFYYLIIVLVMFMFTMIDRLAYLRKNVLIKFIGFTAQVILVHVWLILINPAINKSRFHSNTSALVYYLFRWIYWLISAYQIKCSFPVRVLGNCFSKRYNKLCKLGMTVFFKAPFLFELRVIMDWVFTPTTLKFNRWLQVEDAFVKTFLIKCLREDELSDHRKRGEVQKAFPSKFIYLLIFLALVLVIWAPILLFSFLNTSKVGTEVNYASFELQLGSFEPIFKSSFTNVQDLSFKNATFWADKFGYDFSSLDEDSQSVKRIVFNPNAQQVWAITPPARETLFSDLLKCDNFELTIKLLMIRRPLESVSFLFSILLALVLISV